MPHSILWSWARWVPRPLQSIKNLILNVTDYPSFVPGCQTLTLLYQRPDHMICRMQTRYGVSFDSSIQWEENTISIISPPILKACWTLTPEGPSTRVEFTMTLTPLSFLQSVLLKRCIPLLAPEILRSFIQRA